MNINHRQKLLLLAAVQYCQANIDEVNDSFAADDEDENYRDGDLSVNNEITHSFDSEEFHALYLELFNHDAPLIGVQALTQAAEDASLELSDLRKLFKIDGDRLNNTGSNELFRLLLEEGDSSGWILEQIKANAKTPGLKQFTLATFDTDLPATATVKAVDEDAALNADFDELEWTDDRGNVIPYDELPSHQVTIAAD